MLQETYQNNLILYQIFHSYVKYFSPRTECQFKIKHFVHIQDILILQNISIIYIADECVSHLMCEKMSYTS